VVGLVLGASAGVAGAGCRWCWVLPGDAQISQMIGLAPEQRTRVKEYVVKEKVPRATIKERITVGSRVPEDVELRTVPSDWGPSVTKYRYYHSDRGVHFVDPANRTVIYDVD